MIYVLNIVLFQADQKLRKKYFNFIIDLQALIMDLEWLLPEQLEQLLKFCQLGNLQDMSLAANILETNKWNLQSALQDVVEQNDEIAKKEMMEKIKKELPKHIATTNLIKNNYEEMDSEQQFQLDEGQYAQLHEQNHEIKHQNSSANAEAAKIITKTKATYSDHIVKQQNNAYEQVKLDYMSKKQEEMETNKFFQQKEDEYKNHRKQSFENEPEVEHLQIIEIKLRMPVNGTIKMKRFKIEDKIDLIFKYVSGYHRELFQNRHGDFDLTQTFSQLSLANRREELIKDVFPDSNGEVLIVKEL